MPSLLEDVEQNSAPLRMRKLLDRLWKKWNLGLRHRTCQPRHGGNRQPGCSLSAFAADPGSGTAGLDRDRSRHRERRSLPHRATVCCLARSHPTPALDRRQDTSGRHQQTRKHLSTLNVHSRRTRRAVAVGLAQPHRQDPVQKFKSAWREPQKIRMAIFLEYTHRRACYGRLTGVA
jgi:hypothetical protein